MEIDFIHLLLPNQLQQCYLIHYFYASLFFHCEIDFWCHAKILTYLTLFYIFFEGIVL